MPSILEVHSRPLYAGQTTFGDVQSLLGPNGYRLYGLYEFNWEPDGRLDFVNALFVSPRLNAKLDPHYLC